MALKPHLGYGLGLRAKHYEAVLQHSLPVDWFEIMTETFLKPGGIEWHYLDRIRERYPLVMHGVSLSIGSSDRLNKDYLSKVKELIHRIKPAWVSDHLCWTGSGGKNSHDLLPMPYTAEAVEHIVNRVKQVQDKWKTQILLENVSSYVTYKESEMTEWEFLTAVAEQADCLILLDINNVYVSSYNHHFDPITYLNYIPIDRVQQFHLAGHDNVGPYIVDTHNQAVIPKVWELYAYAVKRFGKVSTIIERDDNIPTLAELYAELEQAKQIAEKNLV